MTIRSAAAHNARRQDDTARHHARAAPGRPFQYPAQVQGDDGGPLCSCTMSDVSQRGARLTIDNPSALPQAFWLLLSADGRVCRRCHVVWRTGTEVGVVFLPLPRRRPVPQIAARDTQIAALDI
jgi:hypothetical protein